MKSKSDQSNPSADEGTHEYPIDCCNHLVTTSLRELGFKYQNLSSKRVDSTDLNKKELTRIVKGTKSDLR